MNTLKIEKRLAEKYRYAPLPDDLSVKYRRFFEENTPEWLKFVGSDKDPIYTSCGSKICDGYTRIVVGDYGAFVEFAGPPEGTQFIIQPGQEYRVDDKKYSNTVKYVWMTIDDGSGVKIYKQKRRVSYADYVPGRYYVSVHECCKLQE